MIQVNVTKLIKKKVLQQRTGFCRCYTVNSKTPIVGNHLPVNTPLSLYGEIKEDKKYGKQFSVFFFCYNGNATQDGKAVGIDAKIVNKFKGRIYSDDFLADEMIPKGERLKALKLSSPWQFMELLNGYNANEVPFYRLYSYRDKYVSHADVLCGKKIFKPEVMSMKNPFILCNKLIGIQYDICSAIAADQENEAAFETTDRVAGILRRQLVLEQRKGHTYTDSMQLIKSVYAQSVKENHAVFKRDIYCFLDDQTLCDYYGIVVKRITVPNSKYPARRVYTLEAYQAEKCVAKNIARLMNSDANPIKNLPHQLEKEEKELGFKLADAQINALSVAMQNNFCVVTGGPGTGKSTIIKGIVDIFKRNFPKKVITLLAPTGKAAQRMSECVEGLGIEPASTIHHILGLIPGETRPDKTLDSDLVIVDESSMIDLQVAAALLSSIKSGAKMIFVGDPNQLPSIGYGAFLEDLIDSEIVAVARLNVVFRQKSASSVAINAARIRNDNYRFIKDDNFRFYESTDAHKSANIIVQLYKECVKNGTSLEDICVLSPRRKKSITGSESLNKAIQDAINPETEENVSIKIGKTIFRINDRIMMTKNIGNVTNGDTGSILDITDNGMIVANIEGKEMEFESDSELAKCMTLGYAMTVHKSQGSEYKTVILTIQRKHLAIETGPRKRGGVKRNLVYTGITRAKQRVFVVGEESAFADACRMKEEHIRRTSLVNQLKEHLALNM